MDYINRDNLRVICWRIVAGIEAHLAGVPSIPTNGQDETADAVKQRFQAFIDAANATEAAHAAWLDASKREQELRAQTLSLVSAVQTYVRLKFGRQNVVVQGDFGFTPPKQAVISPEAKLVAIAKAKATRIARHTMGPKQKLKIKGTLTPAE